MRQYPSWARMEAVAHTLPYDTRIMADTMRGDPAPLQQWASVTTPILIIDGTETFPFMHASADALAAVLPNAERATLEGQDHGPEPEVLGPVLVEFFGRGSNPTQAPTRVPLQGDAGEGLAGRT